MPMEGRIERIEDGSAYGWMSQDEGHVGVKKARCSLALLVS